MEMEQNTIGNPRPIVLSKYQQERALNCTELSVSNVLNRVGKPIRGRSHVLLLEDNTSSSHSPTRSTGDRLSSLSAFNLATLNRSFTSDDNDIASKSSINNGSRLKSVQQLFKDDRSTNTCESTCSSLNPEAKEWINSFHNSGPDNHHLATFGDILLMVRP